MRRMQIESGFQNTRTARLLSFVLWTGLVAVLVVSLIAGLSDLSAA